MKAYWYLVETSNVHWPQMLPFRGFVSAKMGRGYASEADARARAKVIRDAYAKREGFGPDFSVKCIE
jgi:hypothetical protein